MKKNFIVELLVKEKAVFLSPHKPFTWTSGIKSPIYCDNRILISNPEARKIITNQFIDLISPLNPEIIAGTATAGIPWASFIAYEMNLPLIYVRSHNKEHGRTNAIEGKFQTNQSVVLIEDLISTGKSSIAAGLKIKESGLNLIKVLSLFNYNFDQAKIDFLKNKIDYNSLATFDDLIQYAYCNKEFDKATLDELILWKEGKKNYE